MFKISQNSPTEHDVQSQRMSIKTALSGKQRTSFVNQGVVLSQKALPNAVESSIDMSLSDESFQPVLTIFVDRDPALAIVEEVETYMPYFWYVGKHHAFASLATIRPFCAPKSRHGGC